MASTNIYYGGAQRGEAQHGGGSYAGPANTGLSRSPSMTSSPSRSSMLACKAACKAHLEWAARTHPHPLAEAEEDTNPKHRPDTDQGSPQLHTRPLNQPLGLVQRTELSKLAFRICPSTSTHVKVCHRPQLCHPSAAEFPATLFREQPRVRFSGGETAWTRPTPQRSTGNSARRGTCSFPRPTANLEVGEPWERHSLRDANLISS